MIPIIKNEKDFAGTILKNCIGALRVWNDDQQCDITYYYRKTFKKCEKIEELKKYRGSSRGPNKASKEMLDAIENSSRPPVIEIIKHNVPKSDFSTLYNHHESYLDYPHHKPYDYLKN